MVTGQKVGNAPLVSKKKNAVAAVDDGFVQVTHKKSLRLAGKSPVIPRRYRGMLLAGM